MKIIKISKFKFVIELLVVLTLTTAFTVKVSHDYLVDFGLNINHLKDFLLIKPHIFVIPVLIPILATIFVPFITYVKFEGDQIIFPKGWYLKPRVLNLSDIIAIKKAKLFNSRFYLKTKDEELHISLGYFRKADRSEILKLLKFN